MSLDYDDKERRIIPRWRRFGTMAQTGELRSLARPKQATPLDAAEFYARRQEWEKNLTLPFAGDFVGTSLVLGLTQQSQDAAQFILHSEENVSIALTSLAIKALGLPSEEPETDRSSNVLEMHSCIHMLRYLLMKDARNAVAWVDLSRAYAVIGQYKQAEKAMRIALWLQPDNRFVLRGSARLLVHLDKAEEAHFHLARSQRTKTDPWLMAAEISVASVAGKTSLLTKEAQRILERAGFPAFAMAELASAMATLSMNSYSTKIARKLFKQSLQNPTENSVAQASWATASLSGIEIMSDLLEKPYAFEAVAREAARGENWQLAVEQCEKWHFDESYSSRASQIGSYLALMTLADAKRAAAIARLGLEANPNNLVLLNNLTVALAEGGELAKAKRTFTKLNRASIQATMRGSFTATEGLLLFRCGDIEGGRNLYEVAIQRANATHDYSSEARALAYLAREEMLAQTGRFDITYERALEMHKRSRETSLGILLQRILVERERQLTSNTPPPTAKYPTSFRKPSH